jgi:starch synthase (maltosyl-transferring)
MTKPRLVSVSPEPAATRLAAALAAPRIAIERVAPQVDGGRYPAKAVAGQPLAIEADIFMDGHEHIDAHVLWHAPGVTPQAVPLRPLGNDRWRAELVPAAPGLCRFTIEAWADRWASYRAELTKKAAARVPLTLELQEGRQLVHDAARRQPAPHGLAQLERQLGPLDERQTLDLFLGETVAALMRAAQERRHLVRHGPELEVDVERTRAGFASWYELFPRSQTRDAQVHGTFDDVIARLPAIRAMGFDVLYFPPIHPIGTKNRKGRNNSLRAQPGDPGSPYAIGSAEGGHEAVHPQLGGIEAFRRLRAAADEAGIELALDFAVQFSPDHPWLKKHPGWFSWRPDGSLKYAENPPKKYEDISTCDFYTAHEAGALWLSLRDVILHWVAEGVKIFRVDNPHTKPLPFWQWLIADVRAQHPDVMFLSEAFTRPAMMYRLAKIGFSQSYTYFTWRHTKAELTEYLTELTTAPPKDFYRPHFFVNTPDINPYFLQTSGRPGFLIRAALATTLSGLWGMYSGFELCEGAPLPGKEEYLDSEKYEIKPRDWTAPGNIIGEITRLNRIRRDHPALQTHLGVRFYPATNDQVLYYGKRTPDGGDFILVAVSLDPHHVQETHFEVPLWELGLPDHAALQVEELMRGGRFTWHGKVQHWRFVPGELPFAIWRIQPVGA